MKKISILKLFALSLIFLNSCKDSEDEMINPAPKSKLEGKWTPSIFELFHYDQNFILTGQYSGGGFYNLANYMQYLPNMDYKKFDSNHQIDQGTFTHVNNKVTTHITTGFNPGTHVSYIDSLTLNRLVLRDTTFYPPGDRVPPYYRVQIWHYIKI